MTFIACARQPKPDTAKSIIQKYFVTYAKTYNETIFAKDDIMSVDIIEQAEIHKHFVHMQAFLEFKSGQVMRINATLEKHPLGWKLVSWENAS